MTTALTFCPSHEYELERFLAFSATQSPFRKVVILALPSRMAMANAVISRHPELLCAAQEYPLSAEYPDYYDPNRARELPVDFVKRLGETAGVVLISGAAVPFPVMNAIFAPPIKPQYNCFKILKALGVAEIYTFTLNALERVNISFLLDDFAGIHQGKRCFVVGNGPSLKALNMGLLKSELTLGSNKVYLGFKEWGFNFSYWGIIDDRQIELYPDEWEKNLPKDIVKFFPFEYLKVLNLANGCPVNTYHTGNFAYPHNYIDPRRNKEAFQAAHMFSSTPDVIYTGWTVTYMLLQIAAVMGCNPIYLIGVDHRYKISETDKKRGYWVNNSGENHFHSQYSAGKIFNLPDERRAEAFFDHAFHYGRLNHISIYNATPGTALKSFPLVDFNSLFPNSAAKRKKNTRRLAPLAENETDTTHSQSVADINKDPQYLKDRHTMTNPYKRDSTRKKVTILLCTPDTQSEPAQRCLNSLSKNTYSKLYKLMIVDNKWDPKFSHPHEMNKCLSTLDTEFMVCLDDDVTLTPGWLEALLEVAENNPAVGAVGCVHTFADGTINHSGSSLYSANGVVLPKNAISPISSVVYTPYVCSACVLFRKTQLSFDETYAKYRFEVDYCYKLWEAGFHVAVSPHKIYHLVSQQLLQKFGQDRTKIKEAHQLDEVVFVKTWIKTDRWDALYRKIGDQLTHPDWENGQSLQQARQSKPVSAQITNDIWLPLLVQARIKALPMQRNGRVAIFGAGKHTTWLERILDKNNDGPKIIAILDDNPVGKASAFGLRPTQADTFDPKTTDAIILSTDCWQQEMAARCRKLYGKKIKWVDLYEGLPPGPYNKNI